VCACGQKHPGRRLSDQVFNGRLPDPPRLFVVDRAKDPSGVEDLVLPDPPRRFVLDRAEDPSGVSGLGIVAEGVEFSDGTAALRWLGEHPSTTVWGSVADIEAVHGHGGSTRTRWVDEWAEL